MLYRKIGKFLEDHLKSDSDKILILEGTRQICKSYIIKLLYFPVYYVMFLDSTGQNQQNIYS